MFALVFWSPFAEKAEYYYHISSNYSRENYQFLTFFPAGIIRGWELLEALKSYFLFYLISTTSSFLAEAFSNRFLTYIFFIFSHLKRSKTILCEFFDCRSKNTKNILPSLPIVLPNSLCGNV